MQSISVYLNPRASNTNDDWQDKISKALFRSVVNYKIPQNLEELYQELDYDIKEKVETVLSVGGDGTMNTLIQKLAGTDISLLVVAGGTANDLARSLGTNTDVKKIVQTIREDIKKRIDLININGRFMATNGGIGFASEVAIEIDRIRSSFPAFNKLMKMTGGNIYSLFLARDLLAKEISSYQFEIESEEYNDRVISPLILINNQPQLAGAYNVAPLTDHQDGTFNVTIFKHQNRIELVQVILKILKGENFLSDKNIVSFETKNVKIKMINPVKKLRFFGDGEVFEEATSWDISVLPSALFVYSPKGLKGSENICTQSYLA